jgi:solute:Na+ symporter, SSS family
MSNLVFTLGTCAFFMAVVGWISYRMTKGEVNTKDGYFLGGRGLTGIFIAGSMVLTNLSAEQLIGLNGSAYGHDMSSMAWEVTAGFAIIICGLVFLPKYLLGAFTTLPGFLKDRFGNDVRRLSVILFLIGYGIITIPAVLYAGALAVLKLFDIPSLLGISYGQSVALTIIVIGVVGSVYAIFGGLKAVTISDTLNGVGLLVIGILVPVLAIRYLGDGSFMNGVSTIVSEHTEKLNAIGGAESPTPFGTIFTGMIFANLFYWGTNQYVIQRALGAKNLAEGQKGVLFSGFFKLLVPFFMMIPGIIAFHLYQEQRLLSIDLAYPALVNDVLPKFMSGFFLAVLLGAVFSSFNSLLNSAATMFSLDVYLPLKKGKVSDDQLIRVAKIASVVIAIFSFIVSPLLMYAPEGLFQIIRIFTGFYNIPIIAVVLVGIFTKRVPGFAAKIAIIFHLIVYGLYRFAFDIPIHFIHVYGILFVIEVGIMLVIGHFRPTKEAWHFKIAPKVNMIPWKYAFPTASTLFGAILICYFIFSPIGLVNGIGGPFWVCTIAVIIANICVSVLCVKRWNLKYGDEINKCEI